MCDSREVSAVHLAEETKKQLAENMFQYLDLDGNNTVEMNELLLVLDALSNPDRIERAKVLSFGRIILSSFLSLLTCFWGSFIFS